MCISVCLKIWHVYSCNKNANKPVYRWNSAGQNCSEWHNRERKEISIIQKIWTEDSSDIIDSVSQWIVSLKVGFLLNIYFFAVNFVCFMHNMRYKVTLVTLMQSRSDANVALSNVFNKLKKERFIFIFAFHIEEIQMQRYTVDIISVQTIALFKISPLQWLTLDMIHKALQH